MIKKKNCIKFSNKKTENFGYNMAQFKLLEKFGNSGTWVAIQSELVKACVWLIIVQIGSYTLLVSILLFCLTFYGESDQILTRYYIYNINKKHNRNYRKYFLSTLICILPISLMIRGRYIIVSQGLVNFTIQNKRFGTRE